MTSIPLINTFWFMLVAYVMHIMDESLLGGSFVEKVREHWWPQYSWRKFSWFNAGYLALMSLSIVLYYRLGSAFLFLPLAWAVERFFNAIWHLWWAIHFKEYSPGLLTFLLIWMQTYFVCFCRKPRAALPRSAVVPGVLIGVLAAAFLSFFMPLVASRSGSGPRNEK